MIMLCVGHPTGGEQPAGDIEQYGFGGEPILTAGGRAHGKHFEPRSSRTSQYDVPASQPGNKRSHLSVRGRGYVAASHGVASPSSHD